ncbi:hypothetical protein CEP51_008493 [Fusarium floridanum]|uniref:Carrier domain-containing protein n=1 Tax=Fusarium floridanum TaxID=1325733 RepID=A0A428RKR3_9HYPO|nr:hypothetical protein CEP51_008493 [Fusarium floridanum]
MAELPDPTIDLDWSGYVSSIHEIFHKNALVRPDRPCVTETESSTSPTRTFTYQQIDEASTTIANYLHDSGIANGDDIMIFAHRSVELVCAFMGTLAPEATVTVLDPLYPPQRQQIYLEVSQPKALISIVKTTDENGYVLVASSPPSSTPLAPLVRKYIYEDLGINVWIPELRLSDAGLLSGGAKGGVDTFNSLRSKASSPPDYCWPRLKSYALLHLGKAAALAVGYLGDPQKTVEKFVDNWLVDNAKWVIPNRRPWPVSPYVVPEISEWNRWLEAQNHEDIEDEGVEMGPTVVYLKRFRRMQAEVRDHLKSRLPAHSVPSIYIMLQKLPLNPNGKVDFPNLPFPDAAARTEDASEEDLKSWEALSETEKTPATQWSTLIPGLNAKTIRPGPNFFDCGGHSLLAQQLLLNIHKSLGADITISVLYANPSLRGLGSQVDCLRSGQAAIVDKAVDTAYAESFDELINTLHDKHQSAGPNALSPSSGATFFLTGATGFLGAYLVKEILGRKNTKLIAHIRGDSGICSLDYSIRANNTPQRSVYY